MNVFFIPSDVVCATCNALAQRTFLFPLPIVQYTCVTPGCPDNGKFIRFRMRTIEIEHNVDPPELLPIQPTAPLPPPISPLPVPDALAIAKSIPHP